MTIDLQRRIDAGHGRRSYLSLAAADLPPTNPTLCGVCQGGVALDDGICRKGLCRALDRALTAHAAALLDGTPAEAAATRTILRAVAFRFDSRHNLTQGHLAEREAWELDRADGLLDTDWPSADAVAVHLIRSLDRAR